MDAYAHRVRRSMRRACLHGQSDSRSERREVPALLTEPNSAGRKLRYLVNWIEVRKQQIVGDRKGSAMSMTSGGVRRSCNSRGATTAYLNDRPCEKCQQPRGVPKPRQDPLWRRMRRNSCRQRSIRLSRRRSPRTGYPLDLLSRSRGYGPTVAAKTPNREGSWEAFASSNLGPPYLLGL